MVRHVVLLGVMGAGKTSIGRLVAERLGRPLVDGDDRLAERTGGRTAADVAERDGLDALHGIESDIALEALASGDPAVIGPAASVCESAVVRDHLVDHVVVWLTGPVELLAARQSRRTIDHSSTRAIPRRCSQVNSPYASRSCWRSIPS